MAGGDHTERNAEILRLRAQRRSYKEIGLMVGVSAAAVAGVCLTKANGIHSPVGQADPKRADRLLKDFSKGAE